MENEMRDTKGTSCNYAIIIAEVVKYDGRGGGTVHLYDEDGNEFPATLDDSNMAPLTDEEAEELRQRFGM